MSRQAIRDGVIEASLDHEKGFMRSKETSDVYCTREPQLAFHQRIAFCLNIHNQSVKAMRYPPKAYNKDLESAEVNYFLLTVYRGLMYSYFYRRDEKGSSKTWN